MELLVLILITFLTGMLLGMRRPQPAAAKNAARLDHTKGA